MKMMLIAACVTAIAMSGAGGMVSAQEPTTANAQTPAGAEGGVALTDKEQAQLKRCKAMPSWQIEQNSKCTALIEKVGGTIQRQDMSQTRQQLGK